MAAASRLPSCRLPEMRLSRHRALSCLFCVAVSSAWAANDSGWDPAMPSHSDVTLEGHVISQATPGAHMSSGAIRWSVTQEIMLSDSPAEAEATAGQFNREPSTQRQRTVVWRRHQRLLTGIGVEAAWTDPHEGALHNRWGPVDRSHDAVVVGVGIQATRRTRLSWEHELGPHPAWTAESASPQWHLGNANHRWGDLQHGLRLRMTLGNGSAVTLRGRSRGLQLGYAQRW